MKDKRLKEIYLAGGCFWGLEKPDIAAIFEEKAKNYAKPILTEVLPLKEYCKAEEYHQKYLDKNPGGYCHIKINGR
jgi:peptide methionine sulfoxide reductase MsrA